MTEISLERTNRGRPSLDPQRISEAAMGFTAVNMGIINNGRGGSDLDAM